MAAENEHLPQRGLLTRRGRQRLIDFEKRRQPADFGRMRLVASVCDQPLGIASAPP
jgi:hypothetical protein